MAPNEDNLTHEEIWDDSALVDSWNEALEEYKKYHSIHVKGGNVNDLINQESSSDAKDETAREPQQPDARDINEPPPRRREDMEMKTENGTRDIRHSHPPAAGPAPVPSGLLGTVRDEGLKRLLMSWYYAGYYTGYYEGQRDQPHNAEPEQR
ncbi:hypothetical protein DL764_007927 [Monosporascus ibericus]|uniref:Survival Motor Neuron Gemin2-binding domain-containing protein n=1 Tax=Monosporascus ibericus TaxID=155417 RepID=A0A4Q4SYS9_9PEZI|nr:hypothetical protein DL764_007927 [Monosporascus ibericus]